MNTENEAQGNRGCLGAAVGRPSTRTRQVEGEGKREEEPEQQKEGSEGEEGLLSFALFSHFGCEKMTA